MELDASSRPRGLLTDAEKQFRKQRGLCNYCGGHGFGTTCPKLAERDAIRAARSVIKSNEMSILPTPQPLRRIQKTPRLCRKSSTESIRKDSWNISSYLGLFLPHNILPPHISDQDLRGKHLVLEWTILIKEKKISTQILIDIGVSGYVFISDSFAQTHDLPLIPLSTSVALETFDGRPIISGNMIYKTILDLSIRMHCECMP